MSANIGDYSAADRIRFLGGDHLLSLTWQISWTDYVRLVFADPGICSDRSREKDLSKSFHPGANGDGDFHRIKFFAASESEKTVDVIRSPNPRRCWIFRHAIDQYYYSKKLFVLEIERNAKSPPRAGPYFHERYMRRRMGADVGTYIFHINDSVCEHSGNWRSRRGRSEQTEVKKNRRLPKMVPDRLAYLSRQSGIHPAELAIPVMTLRLHPNIDNMIYNLRNIYLQIVK